MNRLVDTTAAERVAGNGRSLDFEPLGARVVIRVDEARKEYQAGDATIHLPDNAQEKPFTGAVLSIGQDVVRVRVGERVLFEKYVGVEFDHEGEILLALKESEIIGVFRPKLT